MECRIDRADTHKVLWPQWVLSDHESVATKLAWVGWRHRSYVRYGLIGDGHFGVCMSFGLGAMERNPAAGADLKTAKTLPALATIGRNYCAAIRHDASYRR